MGEHRRFVSNRASNCCRRFIRRDRSGRFLALVFLTVLACLIAILVRHNIHLNRAHRPAAPLSQQEQDRIRLAVLHHLVDEHCGRGDLAFVSIEDSARRYDPPRAMMRALASSGVIVESDSRLIMRDGAYRDRRTGQQGQSFTVGAIHPVNDSIVNVEGGGASAGLSGSYGLFRVVRRFGRWRVLGFKMTMEL